MTGGADGSTHAALPPALVEAARHYQLGRLAEAETACRTLLADQPEHVVALQLLAMIAHASGRPALALEVIDKAIGLDGSNAELHNARGIFLRRAGRLEDGVAAYRRALALDPASAQTHNNLGNALRDQGAIEAAIEAYRQAIELAPDLADAWGNLGAALHDRGALDEAVQACEQALARDPQLLDAAKYLCRAWLAQPDANRALAAARRCLAIAADSEAKWLFAQCIAAGAEIGPDDRASLVLALREGWGRPQPLLAAALAAMQRDPRFTAPLQRARAAWPQRLEERELYGEQGPGFLAADEVLLESLVSAPVANLDFEMLLAQARHGLLRRASLAGMDDGADISALPFYAALARQCFINEFVWAETEEESALARSLVAAIADGLSAARPVSSTALVAAACYLSLADLPGSERLLSLPWPAAVATLLTEQVRNTLEERRARALLPRLTAIEDSVSRAVQDQYEANPYPRWVVPRCAAPAVPIDTLMRRSFPKARIRPLGKTSGVEVLVAGCGTGQQAIETANEIEGAQVLAVDLSLASLGYAQRQTQTLGLANVAYGQADVLKLAALGRQFDVIKASGMLHHLGDPLAGWRILLSLLRPSGLMYVGLYSDIARAAVARLQALVAAKGYGGSLDEIRRFRQELIATRHADLPAMLGASDFYSASGCRDLLFHVQEHRFDLPRIRDFLAENALSFLGFTLPPSIRGRFAAELGSDADMADLELWDAFERRHPSTFLGMYQFWIQKGA